jgi:hypothetical protein
LPFQANRSAHSQGRDKAKSELNRADTDHSSFPNRIIHAECFCAVNAKVDLKPFWWDTLYDALEIYVQPEAGNQHRTAIAVIGGILDVLHIGRHKYPSPEMRRVISFEDILPAVPQRTVANDEAHPSRRKIILVGVRNCIGGKSDTRAVLRAMPLSTGRTDTSRNSAIDLGVSKDSVLPSFQPYRGYAVRLWVRHCSTLIPNPYFAVVFHGCAVMSGLVVWPDR